MIIALAIASLFSDRHGVSRGNAIAGAALLAAIGVLLIVPFARARFKDRGGSEPAGATGAPAAAGCTWGWVSKVPFGAGPLITLTSGRFEGYRGHCNCGWRGPDRPHFEEAQGDVYQHSGAVVTAADGWDRW